MFKRAQAAGWAPHVPRRSAAAPLEKAALTGIRRLGASFNRWSAAAQRSEERDEVTESRARQLPVGRHWRLRVTQNPDDGRSR